MKQPIDYFKELTKIPRCSHQEEKVIDYLVDFARERNLKYFKDEKGNLVIYKDGEGKPVILQGHVDMVCVKDVDSDFSFDCQPIDYEIVDGWITAKGTSLGADNGGAVAMMMAILDDPTEGYPPIEALFTVEEEVGLLGASAIEGSAFQGRTLINLDSEEEGIFTLSCAGGCRNDLFIPFEKVENTFEKAYILTIGGLTGGHSGMEIIRQRGNAVKILPRVLDLFEECSLTDLRGGSADNAICAFAQCIFLCHEDPLERIQEFEGILKKELSNSDPGVYLRVVETEPPKTVLSQESVATLKEILFLLPNGVQKFSNISKEEVETSTNPGMIQEVEGAVQVTSSHRSSVESMKEVLIRQFEALAKLCKGQSSVHGDYPGWEYAPESQIRDIFVEVYERRYTKKPVLQGIHAGLECGVIAQRIGELDMISIGPDIEHVHSPKERMSLDSLQRTYDLVRDVLRRLRSIS